MAYSTALRDKLFELLPAYLRELDGPDHLHADDPPGPLQALLRIIEAQADTIDGDIVQLLNNAFIETCEPWVIPYIGDLVGVTPLFDESRIRGADAAAELFGDLTGPSFRPQIGLGIRADVGKTVYYRLRKGTLPMLEELARDVTGWPAHAVEFFQRLQCSQWLRNHLRPFCHQTPDIRSIEATDRVQGAFDPTFRTVDIRPFTQDEGRYGIRKIGFFLWRLRAYRMEGVEARRVAGAGDFRYHFSPLGQDAPLFSPRRREADEVGLATERHVPAPIRPTAFFEDLRRTLAQTPIPDFSDHYGLFNVFPGMVLAPAPSMMIFIGGLPVPPSRIRCRNLSAWTQPADDIVGIDVTSGRIALGPATVAAAADGVTVYHHYGFTSDIGGGPYRRRAWLVRPGLAALVLNVDGSGAPNTFATIGAALATWAGQGRPDCIIRIRDNRTYAEALTIEPEDGGFIAIEAADERRPHLLLNGALTITGSHDGATVTLSGLLIEGRVEIEGSLGRLRLLHTTLVPGVSIAEPPQNPPEPSISAAGSDALGDPLNTELRVEAAFSIMGPIRLPDHAEALVLLDCIVDGLGTPAISGASANQSGPPSRIERSTLRGRTELHEITLASETIFDGLLACERHQVGCVRFSFVPEGSLTPRRYRCQPDLAIRRALESVGPLTPTEVAELQSRIVARVRPEYASEAYGQPAYLQLHLNSPAEIATGAEDESEMGVYCHLKQPQRAANLKRRLEEYLPFGLEPGLIFLT